MNDGPHEPEDAGFSLNANGPAYTSRQDRHGVPLNYVSEKLSSAIEELHRFGQQHDSVDLGGVEGVAHPADGHERRRPGHHRHQHGRDHSAGWARRGRGTRGVRCGGGGRHENYVTATTVRP